MNCPSTDEHLSIELSLVIMFPVYQNQTFLVEHGVKAQATKSKTSSDTSETHGIDVGK